ncbi:hypothetical protein D3C72_2281930 [compost metagenome]
MIRPLHREARLLPLRAHDIEGNRLTFLISGCDFTGGMQNPQDTHLIIFSDIHHDERQPGNNKFALLSRSPGHYPRIRIIF